MARYKNNNLLGIGLMLLAMLLFEVMGRGCQMAGLAQICRQYR